MTTKGNTNTTCVGLNSSWRPAAAVEAEIEAEHRAEQEAAANKRRTTIIAAVVAVLGFILLCGLCFFVWRKYASRSVKKGQPGFDMEPVVAYFPPANGQTSTASGGMNGQPDAYPMRQASAGESYASGRPLMRNPSAISAFSYSQRDELPPLPTDFDPYSLMNGSAPRKADEAAAERRAALARGHSHGGSSASYYPAPHPSVTSGSTAAASVVGTDDEGAIIVQHRDGGAPPMVLELPPAYDNSRRISALQQHQDQEQAHGAKH